MEQVLRTVNALNEHGFTGMRFTRSFLTLLSTGLPCEITPYLQPLRFVEITMYETLMRPHEVSQIPSLKSVRQVGEELKDMAVRREERRLWQIASSAASKSKRKREEADQELDPGEVQEDASLKRVKTGKGEDGKTTKTNVSAEIRTRGNDNVVGVNTNESINFNFATDPEPVIDPIQYSDGLAGEQTSPNPRVGSANVSEPTAIGGSQLNVSKVFPEVRGHTSYLTFACLVPFLPDTALRNPIE